MDTQRRYITIEEFWRDMVGKKSKTWYYRYRDTVPGFPQPVDLGGRPMLLLDECEAYMEMKKAERDAKLAGRGVAKRNPPPLVKRRVGRPVRSPNI